MAAMIIGVQVRLAAQRVIVGESCTTVGGGLAPELKHIGGEQMTRTRMLRHLLAVTAATAAAVAVPVVMGSAVASANPGVDWVAPIVPGMGSARLTLVVDGPAG